MTLLKTLRRAYDLERLQGDVKIVIQCDFSTPRNNAAHRTPCLASRRVSPAANFPRDDYAATYLPEV